MHHKTAARGPVAILGAGIQGVLTALELAERGVKVDLYEAAPAPLTAASRWNEGKIHLGYLFAQDSTGNSARTMLAGAAAFSRMAETYLTTQDIAAASSKPFTYAVHKDSLLTPQQFSDHAARVGEAVKAQADSLGPAVRAQDAPFCQPLSKQELADRYDTSLVTGAVRCCEQSLDPQFLADKLTGIVASHPNIQLLCGHHVDKVTRDEARGFAVTAGQEGDTPSSQRYPNVINTLWSDRLRIDAMLGLAPTRPWLFRYKIAMHAGVENAASIDSTTLVLGPFGDIVSFGNSLYLSWYPAGRIASSTRLAPPDWESEVTDTLKADLEATFKQQLSAIHPALARADFTPGKTRLQGGVIFTWGDTDVDDPRSEIHQRFDIGPHTTDGYTTIDTGKWCMGPMFARQVADQLAPGAKSYV